MMMKKNIILLVSIAAAGAILAWPGQNVSRAALSNGSQCSSNSDCLTNNCAAGGTCCAANSCGWDYYPNTQCVASGGTRSNEYANLICVSGKWRVVSGGKGCSTFGSCNISTDTCVNDVCTAAASGKALGSPCTTSDECGTGGIYTIHYTCRDGVCCNPDQCGWAARDGYPASCVDNGAIKGGAYTNLTCAFGEWKVRTGQWGCASKNCEDNYAVCDKTQHSGDGVCVLNCTANASKKCYSGDVYWYNSCGVRGTVFADCPTGQTCSSSSLTCVSSSSSLTADGGSCTQASQCASNDCYLSKCRTCGTGRSTAAGGACVCASECQSGICESSVCKSSGNSPSITSITVANGGTAGYIDSGDTIKVVFSEAIKPESVNSLLEKGGLVTDVAYSLTGGVSVSASGIVTIKNIAAFDAGSVVSSGTFTAGLTLDSTGKILTVTLASGGDIEINAENFGTAAQIGGTVQDADGNAMAAGSDIGVPSGSFGAESSPASTGPSITSIAVAGGGDGGYIDTGDSFKITFSEAVDPASINGSLDEGGSVAGIAYSSTGGVSVSASGIVTIKNIAAFDAGSVVSSGTFTANLALSSSGKVLTITLAGGGDIEVVSEDFDNASQTGGTIQDLDGNEMESDSSIGDPSGSFGAAAGEESISALYAKIAQLQAEIAALQKQLAAQLGTVSTSKYSCGRISKYLYSGVTDSEVKCLQEFLKAQGYSVAVTGTYDAATETAVAQFQSKYASEILTPHGLAIGSGHVGNDTRLKINQLIGVK